MAYEPSEIIGRIPQCTTAARESGDLLFFESESYSHTESGVDFHIRHCPALLHKPNQPPPDFAHGPTGKKDPFAPPYTEKLVVGDLKGPVGEEPSYVVLLNKYSIVPNHFLLVTKEFQSQSSPLTPEDLVTAYSLLQAGHQRNTELFAFYNCGDRSGASQPHKHLQFLTPDTGAAPGGPPIERAAQNYQVIDEARPFSLSFLPYAHYVFRLPVSALSAPPDTLSKILSTAFISLLDLTIDTVRHNPLQHAGPPSFNAFLTLQHLHVIPRSSETHKLRETGDELSINALGFAGMLLVKSLRELEAVRNEGISTILASVAFEKVEEHVSHPQLVDLHYGEN